MVEKKVVYKKIKLLNNMKAEFEKMRSIELDYVARREDKETAYLTTFRAIQWLPVEKKKLK